MLNQTISVDDPMAPDIVGMLESHLIDMRATSPPECVHALDVNALKAPNILFFSMRQEGHLLGVVALKELSAVHAEIKSMRTSAAARRKGVASALLSHLINISKKRGYRTVSLETGTQAFFAPAHELYRKFGFTECGPFADYQLDPHSIFMQKHL
ncbi:GNAT family N-acetyltransferase [Alteromonas ponticola]|uniref:GNAT family N-acetyltransferase n=1 Tax=Alteromonas aquimaris TaxID=2998417 RepID=A0ABT3P645_9ALTE|nr:GNAT family N-acetyltransferase [Alteromonas aquimaris]MCW8108015.1 GNAT family N-acetyltransferase [Alteromonas aquimaris]